MGECLPRPGLPIHGQDALVEIRPAGISEEVIELTSWVDRLELLLFRVPESDFVRLDASLKLLLDG